MMHSFAVLKVFCTERLSKSDADFIGVLIEKINMFCL